MSKVIKAAEWRERPLVIRAPEPPKTVAEDVEHAGSLDEEAQQRMFAEIAAKEQQADELLRNAQTESEVLKQEAQNERERLLEETRQECEELKAQARETGHAEGYAAGEAEGKKQAQEAMAASIQAANAQAEKTLREPRLRSSDVRKRWATRL